MSRFSRHRDRWLDKRIPRAKSVVLSQRSIFILPTRMGVAFLIVLGLILLAAINYQNSLAYAMCFLLGSVYAVAILHTWRNLAGLRLQSGRTHPIFAGEQAHPWVRLESRSRAHQAVALGWQRAAMTLDDVPARGACEIELTLPSERRGWLRPERLRVESRFPLGLFVAWSWVDLDIAVLVYPRPLEGEAPTVQGGEGDEEGARVVGVGADDYRGLVAWQRGDSLQRLHWKAYSRGRGLLVKDFAALAGSDLLLSFDALGGDPEARLSLLCHLVLAAGDAQQRFTLQLPGRTLGPGEGAEHQERCLQALALHGAPAERAAA